MGKHHKEEKEIKKSEFKITQARRLASKAGVKQITKSALEVVLSVIPIWMEMVLGGVELEKNVFVSENTTEILTSLYGENDDFFQGKKSRASTFIPEKGSDRAEVTQAKIDFYKEGEGTHFSRSAVLSHMREFLVAFHDRKIRIQDEAVSVVHNALEYWVCQIFERAVFNAEMNKHKQVSHKDILPALCDLIDLDSSREFAEKYTVERPKKKGGKNRKSKK